MLSQLEHELHAAIDEARALLLELRAERRALIEFVMQRGDASMLDALADMLEGQIACRPADWHAGPMIGNA